jgi:hypothetical protein
MNTVLLHGLKFPCRYSCEYNSEDNTYTVIWYWWTQKFEAKLSRKNLVSYLHSLEDDETKYTDLISTEELEDALKNSDKTFEAKITKSITFLKRTDNKGYIYEEHYN